jgi:aquaporin NIP
MPAGSALQSFVLEMILTALLMFVILSVSTGAREKGITSGHRSGRCHRSGGNVRRPDLRGSGRLGGLWIYLVAPVLGAALGVIGCRCERE